MYKSSDQIFDEVLRDTESCRYEYLEILIKKYVNNAQEDIVDIDLSTLKVYKSKTNYLKKIPKKEFGSVTSYECKPAAKKSIKCLQKRVLLEKRDCYRKYAGLKLSSEEYRSKNSKRNLKYLTPGKVYKTLLSVQENKSSSVEESECEESECNETELSDKNHSVLSFEENESILSSEDKLSSSILKSASKKKQKNVVIENSVNKYLTNDKILSANNVQPFSNFEAKNCAGNLLKLYNCEKLKVLIENFSTVGNNICDDNAPKMVYEKLAIRLKSGTSSENQEKRSRNNATFNGSNFKSSYDYASFKSPPKFRFSDFGIGIAPKIYQNKIKPLPYASFKSTVASKSSYSKIKMETPNKNCQDFDVSKVKSLPCSSNKSSEASKSSYSKINMETPNKNFQDFSVRKEKSLSCSSTKSSVPSKSSRSDLSVSKVKSQSCSSNKSSEASYSKMKLETTDRNIQDFRVSKGTRSSKKSSVFSKLNFSPIKRETSTKNLQTLESTSVLSLESLKNKNSGNVETSFKRVSYDKIPSKQEPLREQRILPFRKSKSKFQIDNRAFKEYENYLQENVKIDDLSIKKSSNNRKTNKKLQ